MLFDAGRAGDIRRFVDRVLEPLVSYDRAHKSDLLTSVRVFMATGCNATQAARELFIHLNTMAKRLDRVAQILGPDWQRESASLQPRLALHLLDVTGAGPATRRPT